MIDEADKAHCTTYKFVNEQNIGVIKCRNIANQADFCCELMNRLKIDIFQEMQRSENIGIYPTHMTQYTQREADIIRLRRELMKLSKML